MQRLFVLNFGIKLLRIGASICRRRHNIFLVIACIIADRWESLKGLDGIFHNLRLGRLFHENIKDNALLGLPGASAFGGRHMFFMTNDSIITDRQVRLKGIDRIFDNLLHENIKYKPLLSLPGVSVSSQPFLLLFFLLLIFLLLDKGLEFAEKLNAKER